VDIVCLDLEGVLIPEMWILVADRTSTDDLRVTTRDIADYDALMKHRIRVLGQRGISLADIQDVTRDVDPLPGAASFLNELRRVTQVAILSDTFVQFVATVMARLDYPFLLCNELVSDESGMVVDYRLRQPDGKRRAVEAFRALNLRVQAVGDSFNDISMLRAAHRGYLFRPSETVVEAHPDLTRTNDHAELLQCITLANQPA
jgi:phosphoserine / homoserine phosphotransferase